MRAGFTLIEVLVTIAIVAVLAGVAGGVLSGMVARADSADALAKIRLMGSAVLHYPADHNGFLPPLFPGQVLEYEQGRGGRIVTECAPYLGIEERGGKYLVAPLMPRAYARLPEPKDKSALRVYVMNSALTNNKTIIHPFGQVTSAGKPPSGNTVLGALAGSEWMMSTGDRKQPNVATAPWKSNTPTYPPLGHKRAIFHFDGAAELKEVETP